MKVSLVVATIGRVAEVERLLVSLESQIYKDFEIIIVDQNQDGRLDAIIQRFEKRFTLLHLRVSSKGASRGRNAGIQYATGDVIAFPDDDCWYQRTTLKQVVNILKSRPELDGVTGRFTDANGEIEGRWKKDSSLINKYNVWNSAIAFSIFLKQRVVTVTGCFNEKLGVGAGTPWGAGEETDYLLRSLRLGFKIFYAPNIVIFHPVKTVQFDSKAILRQRNYETGFAYVIRLNKYPFWYFPFTCIRTCAGITAAFLKGDIAKSKFKIFSLVARVRGWQISAHAID